MSCLQEVGLPPGSLTRNITSFVAYNNKIYWADASDSRIWACSLNNTCADLSPLSVSIPRTKDTSIMDQYQARIGPLMIDYNSSLPNVTVSIASHNLSRSRFECILRWMKNTTKQYVYRCSLRKRAKLQPAAICVIRIRIRLSTVSAPMKSNKRWRFRRRRI